MFIMKGEELIGDEGDMRLEDRIRNKVTDAYGNETTIIQSMIGNLTHTINIEEFLFKCKEDTKYMEKFESILNLLGLAIWEVDIIEQKVSFISCKLEEIFEIPKDQITIEAWKSMLYVENSPDLKQMYSKLDSEGKNTHIYRIKTPNGTVKWINETTIALRDGTNRIEKIIGSVEDITTTFQLRQEIKYIATHDELTNLPNFSFGSKVVKDLIKQYKGTSIRFALFCINLDGFSRINNTLGYRIADETLKLLSQKLNDHVKEDCFLFRSQGDEWFVVCKKSLKNDDYFNLAKSMIDCLQDPLHIREYDVRIAASIGISVFPSNAENEVDLFKNAHAALKRSKASGFSNYQMYSTTMNIGTFKYFQLEVDLHKAFEKKELYVVYQPQVDAASKKVTGAEALIRWKHPNWGEVSPGEFIAIAEESTLHHKIADFVMDMVSKQVGIWEKQGISFQRISFNLSAKDFQQNTLADRLEKAIKKYDILPARLEIELTEGTLLQETNIVRDQVAKIKSLGISLSLDDFGTGYSSIHYLKKLPVRTVKIDRSFVQYIPKNTEDITIVKSIIELTKGLNKNVVAEGVETEEQYQVLKNLGCDFIQGYYFSKPVSAEIMTKLFRMKKMQPQQKDLKTQINRRKYNRIIFPSSLITQITILFFNDRKIALGSTEVMVLDISLGGLRFLSHLRLKPNKTIVYGFQTKILGMDIVLNGTIVRYEEKERDIFEYGVEFQTSEPEQGFLSKLLNQVALHIRSNPLFNDGNFIKEHPITYLTQSDHNNLAAKENQKFFYKRDDR